MTKTKCISCMKRIKPLYPPIEGEYSEWMWIDAICLSGTANYGSKFDGEIHTIWVCDNCLEAYMHLMH